MDSATEDMYLQQIQELVSDEDKIVTVVGAASIFKQNVKLVQDLLKKFVKENKGKVSATYILSGTLKKTNQKAVRIVKDVDLQNKKDEFTSDFSEVIYSVQKGKNVDFNIISMANKEMVQSDGKPLLGFVVSKNCTQRTLKTKKLPPLPAPTIKGKSSFFMKTPNKSEEKNEDKQDAVIEKKPTPQKTENKSKQGGIANMFSKMPPKKDKENINGNKINNKAEKETKEDFAMDVDTDVEENVELDKVKQEKTSPEKTKKEEVPKDTKKSNKRQRKDKSADPPNKRRKRIIQRNDSESDDMFENVDDTEDIIEKSDDEPEPVRAPILTSKNKVKKAVEKTYEDEEGFIVTKTEYVFESASEEEVEEVKKPVKVEEKPKPKMEKKNSSNSETEISPKKGVKGKKGKSENNQPSIMSFFKKK